MLRFIIDTEKCIPTGKYGVILQIGLMGYLKSSWDYFTRRNDVKITFGKTKVTLYMDTPYCIICNDLLMIKRRYPECLKMGKDATKFLENYKSIYHG